MFLKLFFWVVGGWWDMTFFVPCAYGHASLSCSNPSWFFHAFPDDPFLGSSSSKVSWSSPFLLLGLPGSSFYRGLSQTSFAPLSLFFLRPRAYPFMGLGFLLPILNGPCLMDWSFLILRAHLLWILIPITFWSSTTIHQFIVPKRSIRRTQKKLDPCNFKLFI